MAKYMFIGSYNADGKKGVMKDGGTKRVESARAVAASVGGSIESMYFAFGKDDLYIVADIPDNAAASALSMAVASTGLVNLRTVVLMTAADVDAAVQRHPEYSPPGK